jgi:predicted 3-demethylubiquinone-9 3-methyltransferase (glyoxalase superfamily)
MMATSIAPFLMFEGNAEAAMTFYLSLFDDGAVLAVNRYGAQGPGPEGSIITARFRIAGLTLMCSDSFVHHDFTFTPANSLFVECASEEEIDRIVPALAEGGAELMPLGNYGFSRKFAWVNDRFGVSWQLNLA